MEFDLEKETALIEAILFLEGEPLDENALAKISELSKDVVLLCIDALHKNIRKNIQVLNWCKFLVAGF